MSRMNVKSLQQSLLGWYRQHRRVMPWRAVKGRTPDPYHVWLSEIMLQQTTVATVGPYFMKFIDRWPSVQDLAKAPLDDVMTAWAGLGYYARARNLHACAKEIILRGGTFPKTEEELLRLSGIGPYTAAAISSIAFNRQAVAVDGNVERVVSRFFAIEEPLPSSKEKIKERARKLAARNGCPSDFTQAFMELGATVCTPRAPKCGACPWQGSCKAFKKKIQEALPRRMEKKKKPVRYGKVFVIQNRRGDFFIEKRTEKGLYQGMYQFPTSVWVENKSKIAAHAIESKIPLAKTQRKIRHSFTHFDLVLDVLMGEASNASFSKHGVWVKKEDLDRYALPTLMKKAIV